MICIPDENGNCKNCGRSVPLDITPPPECPVNGEGAEHSQPLMNQSISTFDGQSMLPARTQDEQNACIDVCHKCAYCTPPYGYCGLLTGCHRGPRHLAMLRSGSCPEGKWPMRIVERTTVDAAKRVDQNTAHRVSSAEQDRRKAVCHTCEDWTNEEPTGCRLMKECDRREGWLMETRWRTADATCLRTSSGLPNKWAE